MNLSQKAWLTGGSRKGYQGKDKPKSKGARSQGWSQNASSCTECLLIRSHQGVVWPGTQFSSAGNNGHGGRGFQQQKTCYHSEKAPLSTSIVLSCTIYAAKSRQEQKQERLFWLIFFCGNQSIQQILLDSSGLEDMPPSCASDIQVKGTGSKHLQLAGP